MKERAQQQKKDKEKNVYDLTLEDDKGQKEVKVEEGDGTKIRDFIESDLKKEPEQAEGDKGEVERLREELTQKQAEVDEMQQLTENLNTAFVNLNQQFEEYKEKRYNELRENSNLEDLFNQVNCSYQEVYTSALKITDKKRTEAKLGKLKEVLNNLFDVMQTNDNFIQECHDENQLLKEEIEKMHHKLIGDENEEGEEAEGEEKGEEGEEGEGAE